MAESAAVRARMAERRGISAGHDDDDAPTDEHELVRAPARRSLRTVLLAALAVFAAGWRSLWASARRPAAAGRLAPRGLRARLIVIAVLAAAVGAGAMVGVEEATAGGGGAGATAASSRAYLGVELGPSLLGEPGALVEFVAPGSPADDAGVVLGDVITSVGGRTVTSPASAAAAIDAQRPGATVALGLDRLGAQMTLSVTLGSRAAGSP